MNSQRFMEIGGDSLVIFKPNFAERIFVAIFCLRTGLKVFRTSQGGDKLVVCRTVGS